MQVLCIFLFWRYFPSRNCPPVSVLKLFEVLAHHFSPEFSKESKRMKLEIFGTNISFVDIN